MSIPPVTIEFLMKGLPRVQESIRNVATTLARAEQQATRDAERGAQQRQRIVDREAKAKNAIRERSATMAGQYAARSAKDAERAANAEVRSTERAERDKVRAVERAEAAKLAIRERSASMAGRYAAQQAAREAREAMSAASSRGRDRASAANAFFGAAGRGVQAGAQRVGGIAMQTAGIAAQLGGGFSIAGSVMTQSNLRGQAATLSAKSQLAGADKAVGADEIYSKAKAIGARQGIDPAEVMKGFDEVQKLTGDMKQAMRVMPGVARLATATGGNVAEMSGLAANIVAANPGISDEKLDSQMRIFTKQGVVGGVEVADFAKYGSRLTAGASMYGGDKEKNEATLGAMAQMSRQYGGAATAAEATLGAQRFSTDIAKHAKSLKAGGIDVSDHHGNLKDAQTVLLEMLDKTGGDVTKMAGMGLGERGVKPLQGVANIFKNAGGGKAGKAAVEAEFAKYTTGVTEKEVSAAEKTVMGAPDKQLYAVMEKLRTSIGEELLPEFVKLAPVIAASTPAFVNILKVGVPAFVELIKAVSDFAAANKGIIADFAAHPIATIVGVEITKSFATAGLGELVKRLIAASFQGGGGGGGLPGGMGMPGAAAGAGAGSFGAVALGGTLQALALYSIYNDTNDAIDRGRSGGAAAGRALVTGDAAQRAKAEADIAKARGMGGDGAAEAGWVDRAAKWTSALTNPIAFGASYATDAAITGLGGTSSSDQATNAIGAAAFTKAADDAAGSFSRLAAGADAAANALSRASSGPNGTGRDTPILNR